MQNPQAAIMLVKWLPDIQSHDLQTWLSESLSQLCTSGIHNRLSCCGAGMISAILCVLWRHQQINTRAVGKNNCGKLEFVIIISSVNGRGCLNVAMYSVSIHTMVGPVLWTSEVPVCCETVIFLAYLPEITRYPVSLVYHKEVVLES